MIMFQVSAIVIALCVFLLTMETISHHRALRDAAMLQFRSTIKLDGDILEVLDNFIEQIFNDHLVLQGNYMNVPYITSAMETELRDTIIEKVSTRMSNTMYDQLSIYYSRQAVPMVIGEKIYELVTLYVSDHNSPKPKS